MSTPINHLATIAIVAQESAGVGGISAKIGGLAAQVAAGIAAVAITIITIVLYWKLLEAAFKSPSPGKLAMVVVVPLLAAFFLGATPSLLDAAYLEGQNFLAGG